MNSKIILPIATLMLLASTASKANDSLELTSTAFADGGTYPVQFTCEGEGVSPPLSWSGLPEGTQSLVLIMDHMPDQKPRPKKADNEESLPTPSTKANSEEKSSEAKMVNNTEKMAPRPPKSKEPEGLRWYWTMYNIPVDVADINSGESVGTLGSNIVDNENKYSPPCSKGPGIKTYTFSLYALSTSLDMSSADQVSEANLRENMSGLILDSDSLSVSFERSCQSPPKPRAKQDDQKPKQDDQKPKQDNQQQEKREPPVSQLPLCE